MQPDERMKEVNPSTQPPPVFFTHDRVLQLHLFQRHQRGQFLA